MVFGGRLKFPRLNLSRRDISGLKEGKQIILGMSWLMMVMVWSLFSCLLNGIITSVKGIILFMNPGMLGRVRRRIILSLQQYSEMRYTPYFFAVFRVEL